MKRPVSSQLVIDSGSCSSFRRAHFEAAWVQDDWLAFADAWRALYQPSMKEVRSGRQRFVKLDILHRRMLEQIRPKFGLKKLDNKVADDLNLAWHRLDAWPDIVPGFVRLKRKFMLAPCSNGNIALMVDIARRNNNSVGSNFGLGNRARLQAEAGRLSDDRGGSEPAAKRSDDGRRSLR